MKLTALQHTIGTFGIVALDEAYLLADLLGISLKESSHEALITDCLSELVRVHSEHASGVVLDPVYTLGLLDQKHDQSGVLVRLEQLQHPDPLTPPRFTPQWSIEDVRNVYGVAKLELYYHPAEETALQKKQLITEIFDFCQYEQIDFLLKLMIYNPTENQWETPHFQEAQLEAVTELQRFTHILALQYPQDALATATLSSNVDVPWLLVPGDDSYETFKDHLRVTLENGGDGFLAGEVLWREIGSMRLADHRPDWPAIQAFLQTTSRDRTIELMRIIGERAAARTIPAAA